MKIGILTLAQETNYGGILQSFALQTVLKRMGHEVYTIDRHKPRKYANFKRNLLSYIKRLKLRYVNHKRVSVCWNPFMSDEEYRIISANTRGFVKRNMSMTRECLFSELQAIDDEYQFDAYVVGSDQVWLPAYYPSSFLDYVNRPGVLKITYAASCGKKSFLDVKGAKHNVRKLADQFVGISVREDSLVQRTEGSLGRKPQHVLDPTMLLSPQDYLDVTHNHVGASPVIFAYILDRTRQKDELLDSVSAYMKLQVARINPPKAYVKGVTTDIDECVYPAIDDWIHNLSRSEFVVTDSFHGTVFAILFNKPFVAIANEKRGVDRFLSLLRTFGLEDRLVTSLPGLDISKYLEKEMDFTPVNDILKQKQIESLNFLLKCFDNVQRN